MPVLGHAFAGVAIALSLTDQYQDHDQPADVRPFFSSSLRPPLVVGLSYLPDIIAQLLGGLWRDSGRLSHSILFAVGASLLLSPVLTFLCKMTRRQAFIMVVFSLLLHDLFDVLQATDRVPWWPFSDYRVGYGLGILPRRLVPETLLFGSLFILFLLIWKWKREGDPKSSCPSLLLRSASKSQLVINGVLITSIMGAAIVTHRLRDIREDQLDKARMLSQEHHEYASALALLDDAEQWPANTRPGRIDYLRGWIYHQLGEYSRAELFYLKAEKADPTYFWTVADLVELYVSLPIATAERCRLLAPYLIRLLQDFGEQPELAALLVRVHKLVAVNHEDTAVTGLEHSRP
ncbi:MAG: metal-dependent hydrolase [Candidatus Binatia bacterium]